MKNLFQAICILLFFNFITGCATTQFKYTPSEASVKVASGVNVQIGQIRNNWGFTDPRKIRFNADFNKPVSEAIREALTLELQNIGILVGSGDLSISLIVESKHPSEGLFDYWTYWTFTISRVSDEEVIFKKRYNQERKINTIFDEEGQVSTIRSAISQFINDQQMKIAIRGLHGGGKAAETAKRSTEASALSSKFSDVDNIPEIATKRRPNAYAIVIGIEQYRQKLPRADYATSDARTVTDYLVKIMGYPEENIVTLLNENAAMGDFIKYFERWLSNNIEKDGTVFVYYSGHGAPNPKTGDAYLVPYDGDPSFISETGYPLRRLYDSLGKLPAKEIIVALDSCFSGGGGRSVIAKGSRPLVMSMGSSFIPSNTVVLSAASGDQISSTYDEKGHGLFTYFLLSELKKGVTEDQGRLEIGNLYKSVRPKVERVARKMYNNEQNPQLIAKDELLKLRLISR